jgi:alkanesulfonate monooxygenase SsuD/methylene tetrahydromethanopterin reductase-like flavin-dependent oxidoreductase (luciferase family)
LDAIQAYARQTEESGFMGGFWIAEAYHWFRQYGLESRGCFTTLAAATMATRKIPIGLGITSPYMRHPTIQANECAGIDELSGGRFIMGLGVGKVGIEYLEYDTDAMKPVPVHHESLEIIRKVLTGEKFSYEGKLFKSEMPAYDRAADGLRTEIPIYVGATGPFMQRLAGRESDGLLLAGLTSPAWVRTARKNMKLGADKAGRTLPEDLAPRPRSARRTTPAPMSSTSCATSRTTRSLPAPACPTRHGTRSARPSRKAPKTMLRISSPTKCNAASRSSPARRKSAWRSRRN